MKIAATLATVVFAAVAASGGILSAQATPGSSSVLAAPDSSHCDSIVGASIVDSVSTGLFLSVVRVDGGYLESDKPAAMMAMIGAAFTPPRPFRLTVFSGAPRFRFLRQPKDSATLHPPVVTGVYRVHTARGGTITRIAVLRASLMPGFDTAAASAIRASSQVEGTLSPPEDEDSMVVDVGFSTDSSAGARRLFSAWFPRMPVTDAVPLSTNPSPIMPADAKAEGITSGDIVLRFVVDRRGAPVPATIELVRGTSLSLLRAALTALPAHRFTPASIKGCAVAQLVEYAFNFLSAEPPPRH